ncbi:MAG TPA: asparagine synthase-related protein [Acidimicrobiales bacterium]|nr:asparagine synthase-related protein [Acidimicrobiales bacterium]
MDIYVGAIGPGADALRTAVGERIASAGLPHRAVPLPSATTSAWTDAGELAFVDTDELEILFDGYLHGHGHPTVEEHLPILAERVVQGRAPLAGRESGIFNLVVRDKRTGAIHLASDPSALFPLYFGRLDDGFFFGSHLYLTAKALGAAPDLLGTVFLVLEQFALGSRTYFEGVERLCAGEVVTFDARTGTVDRRYPEIYFDTYTDLGPDTVDELWNALLDAARPEVEAGSSVGIMLSEGFDSRLVAGAYQELGADLHTFTHGTEGTVGTTITREVADRLGSSHRFEPLAEGFPSDLDQLRRQLLLSDNLHIPFWSHGADHFRAAGVSVTTTGYALDTTLGAHAFAAPSGSSARRALDRYRDIVRQDLGRVTNGDIESVAAQVLASTRVLDLVELGHRTRRFLAPELAAEVVTRIDDVPDAITAEQERLRRAGATLDSQVVQRYFLENRVRRFSFGQELTLRTANRVVVPCYEPAFLRPMSRIHPRHRLNHKLYLQLLRRHAPGLARIRSGAHGLPPTYPRIALETGRFGWKAYEDREIDRYMAAGDPAATPNIRRVLFPEETAHRASTFAIERLFDRETMVINQESMQLTVDKVRRSEIRVYPQSFYLGLELTQLFDEL